MAFFRKIKAGLVKSEIASYVGEEGNLFFNVDSGELRLGDGVTPGGLPIGGNSVTIIGNTEPQNPSNGTLWFNPANNELSIFYQDENTPGWSAIAGSLRGLSSNNQNVINVDTGYDIVPSVDSGPSLGSVQKRFKSLYLSGNSLYIDNTRISVNAQGDIMLYDANDNLVSIHSQQIYIGDKTDPTIIRKNTLTGRLEMVLNSGTVAEEIYSLAVGYTGSRGELGYTGSQGNIGYTGSQGIPGEFAGMGYTGSQGVTGFTGSRGDDGLAGYTGSQGEIGYTGSQGVTGFTGSKGDVGFTGSQGEIGYTGSIGFTGSRGDFGYTGSQGEIGFTGSRGEDGLIGRDGYTGSQGATGFTGSIGFTGSKGDQGAPLNVVGFIDTTAELPSGYQGNVGDGYIVRSNFNLWIWDATQWVNSGSVSGGAAATSFATKDTPGIVRIGENINVNNGVISVPKGAGINKVIDIPDVYVPQQDGPENQNIIRYNQGAQRWETKDLDLSGTELDGGFY